MFKWTEYFIKLFLSSIWYYKLIIKYFIYKNMYYCFKFSFFLFPLFFSLPDTSWKLLCTTGPGNSGHSLRPAKAPRSSLSSGHSTWTKNWRRTASENLESASLSRDLLVSPATVRPFRRSSGFPFVLALLGGPPSDPKRAGSTSLLDPSSSW